MVLPGKRRQPLLKRMVSGWCQPYVPCVVLRQKVAVSTHLLKRAGYLRELQPYPTLHIHPDTAISRGIKHGDWVIVESPHCWLKVKAESYLCPGSPLQRSPGSAPRYSAFHPQLPYLFVNKENKPLISAFRYDEEGKLEHIWTVDALPPQITPSEGFLQSDICLGKSGQYLYSLLRVVNVISVFKIDGKTGKLTLVQAFENACAGGRGCAVSPDGRFLIVAALEGHEVAAYPIGEDGRLSPAQ